ncbi:MAG: BamA/TamA family outer membrane protein, partial [Chlorobiales bacterium]|nr:BamA/TamA family outer membrane protein [Chlorobiales bacterium]
RNFSGHGDLISASFGVGFDPFVGLSYNTPYVLGSNRTGFGFLFEHRTLRNLADVGTIGVVPNYNQTSFNIGVSFSQRLTVFELIGCSFDYNSVTVNERTLAAYPSSATSPDGKDRFLSAGLFYRYQQLDFILFPMEGFFLNATVSQNGFSGASDEIGFTRGTLDVRFYKKLIGDLAVGFRNYSLVSSNRPIPNHQRLFIGFTTQIRGYTSTILNGDNIQFNSAELRYPIIKLKIVRLKFIPIERLSIFHYGLFATAFLDGGTIWYNSHSPAPVGRLTQFNFSDYKYGYGAGLVFVASRWTARFDVAFNQRGTAELVFEKSVSF